MTINEIRDWPLMVFAAVNYCMGRRSYMTAVGQDWAVSYVKTLNEADQAIMLRDIISGIVYQS
ncbi:MAG: hypothetical protein N3D11_17875, partial [Candidatus Sumerlaeia bacterium]|nr:hypothetical protein [Candidatus Sumerlaeia bacterium]